MKLFSMYSNLCDHSIPERHRQTDGRHRPTVAQPRNRAVKTQHKQRPEGVVGFLNPILTICDKFVRHARTVSSNMHVKCEIQQSHKMCSDYHSIKCTWRQCALSASHEALPAYSVVNRASSY